MNNKHKWIVEIVAQIVKDAGTPQPVQTAEVIVDRLSEEGVLHVGYGNADVDKILKAFSDTFGTTKASKYDRYASTRLATKYGSQSVVEIIRLLGKNSTEKYAPVVNSVVQLEEKMPSVLNFLRSLTGSEEIDV